MRLVQLTVPKGIRRFLLRSGWVVGVWASLPWSAIAQITPDNSLGVEASQVTSDVFVNGDLADLIEGGALRNRNLFHSFFDFSVNAGQRVYFANPALVENIITRVTGLTASQIRGTLGVDGAANLYIINPNGIIFGPNAQLDVRGSFTASTADSLTFEDGYTFSAIAPTVPSLLAINTPAGLSNWLPERGTLVNQAVLAVGNDLVLTANQLDLQGQLQSGGNLILLATDTLLAQDTSLQPLRLTAGETLLMQGNQGLEVVALAHPDSGLFSGGELILRSDQTLTGDAHFEAGGGFRIEQLDGTAGAFASPNDPVIRASGDVSFGSYEGASLHILAGGSVTAEFIDILGPDTTGNALQEVVTLSDGGTAIAIDGNVEPTVDIRAGTLAFGSPGITGDVGGLIPDAPPTGALGTSADITIDEIFNPGGLVFLTNQYVPNPALAGDITVGNIVTIDFDGGGDIVIDAKGAITTPFVDASGGDVFAFLDTFDPALFNGNGGDLLFRAEGQITLPEFSEVYTYGLENGSVTFVSNTAIVQEADSFFEGSTVGVGTGGNFRFEAPAVVFNGGGVSMFLDGEGTTGDLQVVADTFKTENIDFQILVFGTGSAGDIVIDARQIDLDNTFLGTLNVSFTEGMAGDITINAETLNLTGGAQIASTTADFVVGDAGNVSVTATESVNIDGFLPGGILRDDPIASSIVSSIDFEAEGNGGQVDIVTDRLNVTNGGQIRASSLGFGDAGVINIAANSVSLDGAAYDEFSDTTLPSAIVSEVIEAGTGQGGNVNIITERFLATNGGVVSVSTDSAENAGNINITASESVIFDGVTAFDSPTLPEEFAVRESGLRSEALEQATGSGGGVDINTPLLYILNGATLEVSTLGGGNAGSYKLNVSDTLLVDGEGSSILANTLEGSSGLGGNIIVDPEFVIIRNGGQIAVDSQGTGAGGFVDIRSAQLRLENGVITAETVSSAGGNILLTIADLIVMENGSRISSTAGTAQAGGDGGNIEIGTTYLIAIPDENNDITANAFLGSGGRVLITAEGVFGLTPRSRAELEQLLGTSDPALLDPINLPSSDITAISQVNPELNGEVIINSPATDPNQGTIALPENIVDPSRLIAQGCSGGSIAASEIGSLIVTGRGGLPADPTASLNSNQLLLGWATAAADTDRAPETGLTSSVPQNTAADITASYPLQEVQALALNEDGEVVLLAQGDGHLSAASSGFPVLTCAGEVQENEP